MKKNTKLLKDVNTSSNHSYEYLVLYVHFIERITKRLNSKGFYVSSIMDFDTTKMVICRDPNGIQVRLIEMNESYLNMNNKKQVITSKV